MEEHSCTTPSAATLTPPTGLPVVTDVPPWRALAVDRGSVRKARKHAQAILDGDGLAEVAVLIVSELVTNAILHHPEDYQPYPGVAPILLSIQIEARWVLIAVRDPWPEIPISRDAAADDESGRGLAIVCELAAALWTEVHEHGGKTVCALVLRPGVALAPGELWRLRRS